MGLLTDFLVADPADAPRIGESINPAGEFGGFQAKRVDDVVLGELWTLLDPARTPGAQATGPLLFALREDGPWVQEVSPELVRAFAALTDERARDLAPWAAARIAAAVGFHYDRSWMEVLLRSLAALSRHAGCEGKALLTWVCL